MQMSIDPTGKVRATRTIGDFRVLITRRTSDLHDGGKDIIDRLAVIICSVENQAFDRGSL